MFQITYKEKYSFKSNNTNTSESKNLTVSDSNVQLNQTATGKNLTVGAPNNLTQVNGTTDQTNTNQTENTNLSESVNNCTDTNSINVQVDSSSTLTCEQMQDIIGMGWRYRRHRRCWDVDTLRYIPRHRSRRIDRHRVGRFALGTTMIVGGGLMFAGGVKMGWNPGGWVAMGKGLTVIGYRSL